MRRIPIRLWSLAVISGALQMLPFPMAGPAPMWRTTFCWIALIPLIWALLVEIRPATPLTVWQGAWLGYASGFVWYLGNCYWIYRTMNLYGGLPESVSLGILILFALYLGLYHALFGAMLVALRRSRVGLYGPLALAPACWVAVELMRSRITGFPWDPLGNSQVDNLLLTRIAPVAGVMAISFVIVSVNCLIACFLLMKRPQGWSFARVGLVFAAALQTGGTIAASHADVLKADRLAVLLQENLEVGAVGKEIAPLGMDEVYRQFIGLSEHPQMLGSAVGRKDNKSDLIAWPEAPSGFFTSDSHFRDELGGLAKDTGAAVIAGSLGVDLDTAAARGYKLYDSAALVSPDGKYSGRYDKIHLVPWGEYVPFKELFFFATKLTAGVGNMDAGTQRNLFHSGGHAYGVFICYESIFGDEVRQFVKNGAEVLVNISDDGWYGDTGAPWQHLNMARMRAIENHRWVVRDTNTGVTTTIDPLGQMTAQAPRHVRGAYLLPFGYASDITLYTRFGDWFAWICAAVIAGGLMYGWLGKDRDADPLRG